MTDITRVDALTGDQSLSLVDVLVAARALIAKPENWKKAGACHIGRTPTCAAIALSIASNFDGGDELRKSARAALASQCGTDDIIAWNDAPERTHADVLAAFDRAIERATGSVPGSPAQSLTNNEVAVVQEDYDHASVDLQIINTSQKPF